MFRREHNNQKVDAIGRKLVENDLLSVNEIDRIVEKPGLFDQVNRRIAVIENGGAAHKAPSWVPVATASFASLAIISVLALAVIDRIGFESIETPVTYFQVPDVAPDIARPSVPPKPIVTKLSVGRAQNLDDLEIKVEKAAYRRPTAGKANIRKAPILTASEAEFYPVAYTGDPAETAGGGRIIRVDLDRSSLFALGVNMPLENDHARVKADLLIGMDGVTRAIRLVE
jgi:hypothetical protein